MGDHAGAIFVRIAGVVLAAVLVFSCVPPEPPPEPPPSAAAVAAALSTGGGAAMSLGSGLADDGRMLHMMKATATMAEAQMIAETALAANEAPAVPTSCVALVWTGLSATITYDMCDFEGVFVDGAITITVVIDPTSFTLAVDNLTIDTTLYDGSFALSFTAAAVPVLDVDFSFTPAGVGATRLRLIGVSVAVLLLGVSVDGTGAVESPEIDASLTAAGVTWTGACHPNAGTATYMDPSVGEVGLRFLPSTPATGEVEITFGGFPPFNYALLQPCAS